ncbi:hypothetical protein TrLO_g5494 [Triparma laevis f. longispina]|uniref:Uncharacterized protein n=1 Tax=Triparma laevis f. longispina TaxID=1714387 RepID=A0A9W7KUF0_9STRA|nr:hypothetical protein TrLO_g5494 [Triparma laevis f. longispina]
MFTPVYPTHLHNSPPLSQSRRARGDSVKAFGKAVKKEAAMAAGKGLGGGLGVKQGVNTEALGKLMESGGGPIRLERLNIGINFAQNLGLVVVLKWLPVDFKKWFG